MTTQFKHGSEAIKEGKLRGSTDTDYFYFFCPKCKGSQVLRLLNYRIIQEQPRNEYDEGLRSKSAKGFTLQFKLYCESCGLTDFVKLSNFGRQSGELIC